MPAKKSTPPYESTPPDLARTDLDDGDGWLAEMAGGGSWERVCARSAARERAWRWALRSRARIQRNTTAKERRKKEERVIQVPTQP